jgi:cobyrinic acid a,c-diamide synthase
MSSVPRLVIAGTHSGVGKTTVATALMAAFTRRGLRVQPFKVGPDFIDPGFHTAACGRASRNLDGWMLSPAANLEIFGRASADADLAIVEGVMGLFDGRDAATESGSTAELAKWLRAPVVLVTDASAMARSAAALVRGFETFDPALDLAGIIFNRIGGPRHADILREAVAAYCRSTPVAWLPCSEAISLPSRHLGLTMAAEALTPELLSEMVSWIEQHADLDTLLDLARSHSPALDIPLTAAAKCGTSRVRIGVARDRAFCFYYQDNLDLLRESGAELVEFSPLDDRDLPPAIGGLYLGGGYPEIHAATLSQNQPMLQAIRRFAGSGAPVYAECGGFMYLTEAIVDAAGREHAMVGLFPTRARMQSRFAALGYIEAEAPVDALWLRAGERIRGHEFRYSEIDAMPPDVPRCFTLQGSRGARAEGYTARNVLAGYAHLHFRSSPEFAARFVEACAGFINGPQPKGTTSS